MKIDFSKIQIKDIEGKMNPRDMSKELGNIIFQNTNDIGELDLARDIYHKKEVDMDKAKAEIVKRYVEQYFLAFVKEAILPVLDIIIKEVKPNKK
jgi:hypothetical protein